MKKIYLSFLICISSSIFAQGNMDSLLIQVETNNLGLQAMRKSIQAEIIGNMGQNHLYNPEISYNYLWGSPSIMGNRKDFSVSQEFDFPTAYIQRFQFAKIKNKQSLLRYEKKRLELINQVKAVCIELTYAQKLIRYLEQIQQDAKRLSQSYEKRFTNGDIGVLDYNKSGLYLLTATNELENTVQKRTLLLEELKQLNGSIYLQFSDSIYQETLIPSNFNPWYSDVKSKNPTINWAEYDIALAKKDIQVKKSLTLPKISTGYMSETLAGEEFRGITLGLSIPIWEHTHGIKQAKANKLALEAEKMDIESQLYSRYNGLYIQANSLQNQLSNNKIILEKINNTALLKKALDLGEINLQEYLIELNLFQEAYLEYLDLEKRYQLTILSLHSF